MSSINSNTSNTNGCTDGDIKVSVLCVAYNHEKYIRKALEGFVMQKTDFRFEVIIHDDASTDHTADIIREYAAKYPELIKPIYAEENRYSKGINIYQKYMLPIASGEYYALCEGDDYWFDENKLQMQYDIMSSDLSLSICVHKVQCVNESGSPLDTFYPGDAYKAKGNRRIEQKKFSKLILPRYMFHTTSYFLNASFFKENMDFFDRSVSTMNDDELFIRMGLLGGDAYYIDKVMSYWRVESNGSWNRRRKKWSAEEELKYRLGYVRGSIILDECSNGKFHEDIAPVIFKWVMDSIPKYGSKAIIDEFDEQLKSIAHEKKYIPAKYRIKYRMFKYFPRLSGALWKILK